MIQAQAHGVGSACRSRTDITAQEKFKRLKSGEFSHHVYYNCTRRVDPNCSEKYINETNLCILLQEFIEENHKKIRISSKLQAKVERHFTATQSLLAHYEVERQLSRPLIEYARYVLSSGTDGEKTALANGIQTKLLIKGGQLELSL